MSGNTFFWLKDETPIWRQKQEPKTPTSTAWSRPNWRRGSDSSDSNSSTLTSSSPPSSCGSSPPSRAWNNDWRAPRVPRTPSPTHSAKPAFDDLRLGKVMHLPREESVPKSSVFHDRMAYRGDRPWGHPVVVLEKNTSTTEEMVRCQLVTSFQDGETFAKKSDASKENIALCQNTIDNKAHQGLNGVSTRLLTLEPGSDQFLKPSFVNFYDENNEPAFWIEYRHIQPWIIGTGRVKNIIFDQESLERIKKRQVR